MKSISIMIPEEELILESGYAWVTDDDHVDIDFDWFKINIHINNGNDYGYVFKPNGRVDLIEKDGSHWEWVSTSRYSIKDNDHIKIGSKTFDFEIDDGDELYLDGVYFEKKWVENIAD